MDVRRFNTQMSAAWGLTASRKHGKVFVRVSVRVHKQPLKAAACPCFKFVCFCL